MKPWRGSCRQAGFGLIELMVALALGLVVVGAASMIFVGTKQASGTTDNLSRMQESVRTSYDLMTREVREAGGTPCDSQLLMADVLNSAQGATPTWWAVWTDPLSGYDGTTAFPGAAIGSAVAQRVAATEAVIVRYGQALDTVTVTAHDTANATFTVSPANHGVAVNDVLMACNYKQAAIFQATATNTVAGTFAHGNAGGSVGNCSIGLGLPTLCSAAGTVYQFSPGSLIGRYTAVGWYIGNNGRADTGGRSLYRVTRTGPEEVAEGVRDMQLHYLLFGANDYVVAASVADWSKVIAVRIDLTFEGSDANSTLGAGSRLTRTAGFTVNLRNLQP